MNAPSVGVGRRGEPGPFPGAGREAPVTLGTRAGIPSLGSRLLRSRASPPPRSLLGVVVQTLPPASGASGLQTTTPGRPRGGPRSPGLGVLGILSRWSRRGRAARLAGSSSGGAAGGLSHTPRPLGRPLADRLGAFRPLAPPGRAGGTQTYGQVEGSTGALGSGRDRGPGRLPEEGGWDLRRRGGPGLVGRGHAWGCASALPSPARPAPAVPAEPRPGRSAGP